MKCLHCQIETKNPKFCNRSCAAKYNGVKFPKRKPEGACAICSVPVSSQRKYCTKCYNEKVALFAVDEFGNTFRKFSVETIKKHLIKEHGHRCWECKNTMWNGHPIPLEMDHIDGNSQNNRKKNLRILCPNCHALTPTYRGKNKKKAELNLTQEEAKALIEKHKSIHGVLISLGLAPKGGNYKKIKKLSMESGEPDGNRTHNALSGPA